MSTFLSYFSLFSFLIYIIYKVISPKRKNDLTSNYQISVLEHFKSSADRYLVHFDNCEFREDRLYSLEEGESLSDLRLATRFATGGSLALFSGINVIENTVQSVLYYQDPQIQSNHRLCQGFPLELTSLKYHVRKGELYLYISKTSSKEYLFDVERVTS